MSWIQIEWDGNEDLVNLSDVVSARRCSNGSFMLWFSSGRCAEFQATSGKEHLEKMWQALKDIAMVNRSPVLGKAK